MHTELGCLPMYAWLISGFCQPTTNVCHMLFDSSALGTQVTTAKHTLENTSCV